MELENVDLSGNRVASGANRAMVGFEDTITNLARSFESHPGFMWTNGGFEILHADWPTYPLGHGISVALSILAEYPRGTRFFLIDSIDQCTLLVVGEKPKEAPYSPQHLHVAVWDDDLRACASAGYIEGVHDDDEYLTFPKGSVTLTEKGLHAAIVNELLGPVLDVVGDDIISHLHDRRYDTAVREIALRVEIALRRASGLSEHGRRLVGKCFGKGGKLVPKELPNASHQILRNVFQGYFKYVRNEYAHTLPPVDMLTACRLVRRSTGLLKVIKTFEAAVDGTHNKSVPSNEPCNPSG